jgi:2-octaprenyl-6-methoxyphenol hydroxylase
VTEPIDTTQTVDIAIIGAGPVGMTLALALAGGPHRVLLIDSRPRGASAGDPRALALSHGTQQLLERLNAWNSAAGTPIHDIHVSQRGGFGRTIIDRNEQGVPALGYVMRYRDLAAALDARIDSTQLLDDCQVDGIETGRQGATLTVCRQGTTQRIAARLIVHAEGTPGNDTAVDVRDYRQHAVVAEVRPAPGHKHRAWERFTPDGPLALLPLGQDYSIVFTVPPEKAAHLLQLDDTAFLAALRVQFGSRLDFTATGPRASFPLALRIRRQLTEKRQVWIGNCAQTLHPVSGQGFNLGLRDAWELAEILLNNHSGDAGDPAALAAYARGRKLDRVGSTAFTDGIVRLFSNDLPPLRFARGLGLLALDLYPTLRHFVAKRMIWGARAWP